MGPVCSTSTSPRPDLANTTTTKRHMKRNGQAGTRASISREVEAPGAWRCKTHGLTWDDGIEPRGVEDPRERNATSALTCKTRRCFRLATLWHSADFMDRPDQRRGVQGGKTKKIPAERTIWVLPRARTKSTPEPDARKKGMLRVEVSLALALSLVFESYRKTSSALKHATIFAGSSGGPLWHRGIRRARS